MPPDRWAVELLRARLRQRAWDSERDGPQPPGPRLPPVIPFALVVFVVLILLVILT